MRGQKTFGLGIVSVFDSEIIRSVLANEHTYTQSNRQINKSELTNIYTIILKCPWLSEVKYPTKNILSVICQFSLFHRWTIGVVASRMRSFFPSIWQKKNHTRVLITLTPSFTTLPRLSMHSLSHYFLVYSNMTKDWLSNTIG